MLSKLLTQIRKYDMLRPGDKLVCAVSGGADSMALLWAMYLLRDKLGILLEAAHFNHGLRGEESDRDEAFVADFCRGYGISCHLGKGAVVAGKKGLEAAARAARYAFFETLSGKIATAHTADDNAETVLMHLVRGTGLKGLGGIMPVNGNVLRPMLTVTRQDVLDFLTEFHIPYVSDSSNDTDAFLRNRLRHHVMPLLKQENPQLAQNLSAMAMELREDEEALQPQLPDALSVAHLRDAQPSCRRRLLARFLQISGVREPERAHIEMAEKLVFSDKPSAWADFPGNVRIRRCYDALLAVDLEQPILPRELKEGTALHLEDLGLCLQATRTEGGSCERDNFTVQPCGKIIVRSRQAGDKMRLSGGTKTLKKLFIDRKIPEHERMSVVVIADDQGVLGVCGIGANLDRTANAGIQIKIQEI